MSYLEKCPQKDTNIVSRKVADEVILVPIRQNVGDLESVFTLNEVGAFIWEQIDGRRQVKEIKEMIVEEFDVSPQGAESDLIELLREMENMKLILVEYAEHNQ